MKQWNWKRMIQVVLILLAVSICSPLLLYGLTGCEYDPEVVAFRKAWGFGATLYEGGQMPLDEEKAIALASAYIEIIIENNVDPYLSADYTYSSSRYDNDNKAWFITFVPGDGSAKEPCHVVLYQSGEVKIAWGFSNQKDISNHTN